MYVEDLNEDIDFENIRLTAHIKTERSERLKKIEKNIGRGSVIHMFYVDKNHPNGPEIHIVTSTGLIYILNYYTHKFVSVLIARPNQIIRLFSAIQLKTPNNLIQIASQHQSQGMNFW